MTAILTGLGVIAAFVLVVALIGWEPRHTALPKVDSSSLPWSVVPGEFCDRLREAELTAREHGCIPHNSPF